MPDNRRNGMRYEDIARRHLEDQGLEFLQANYQCRFGEIDLIMRDEKTLCFIEVKYRASMSFGGAAHAISSAKQKKLVKSALCFISSHHRHKDLAFRFDAFLIQQDNIAENCVNWIKNAFYADQDFC